MIENIEFYEFSKKKKKRKNDPFREKEKIIRLENVRTFDARLENEHGICFKDQPDVYL